MPESVASDRSFGSSGSGGAVVGSRRNSTSSTRASGELNSVMIHMYLLAWVSLFSVGRGLLIARAYNCYHINGGRDIHTMYEQHDCIAQSVMNMH